MNETLINIKLMEQIREYIKIKTGKQYFKHIRQTANNLIVTCPFHKGGQENKPSASIRITSSDKASIGLFSCFTCHENMMLSNVLEQILGTAYNKEEVEARFGLDVIEAKSSFITPKKEVLFKLPETDFINPAMIKQFKFYHPYLEKRRITKDVAALFDLGYDQFNNQITFPIYDLMHNCIGVGRRSIDKKVYHYPMGMQKPLYGLYELDRFLNYVWVVEGPFNLWSLKGWGKQGVALLGTGTDYQYKQALTIDCKGYVLALDPDEAGRKGTLKLGNYLQQHRKYNIFVALIPEGKDVNDLTLDEFNQVEVVSFSQWKVLYKFD